MGKLPSSSIILKFDGRRIRPGFEGEDIGDIDLDDLGSSTVLADNHHFFDSKMKKIIQKLQNLQAAGNNSLDNICQIYLQLLIFWIALHFLQENIKKKLRGNCSNIRNLQGVNGSRPNIRKSFFLIWTPKKNKWNSSKFSDCQKHFICILPNLKNARVFSKLNVQEACGISAWMSNQIFLLQWSHHMDAVAGLASLLF